MRNNTACIEKFKVEIHRLGARYGPIHKRARPPPPSICANKLTKIVYRSEMR